MGKKEKEAYNALMAAIRNMQNPASNPAQNALTQEALAAADFFKKGDFTTLPKGYIFDFEDPVKQQEAYKKAINVGNEGVFALGAGTGGGDGAARAVDTQSKYLSDKFGRDTAQNYQNNISNAGMKTREMLAQSAGANSQNQSAVIGALSSLYGTVPKGTSWLGGLLGMAGSLGSAAIGKW